MYSTIHDVTVDSLKKHCTLIHYFGLGFIQVKLGDRYRMHFYTDKLPTIISDEEIHNHRYDFTSHILYGTFTQKLYQVVPGTSHTIEDESCTEGTTSIQPPRPCSVYLMSQETLSTGRSYHIAHPTFHTVASSNAITLLDRGPHVKAFAQVIRPVNTPKTCPFSKKVPEAELWRIVESLLVQAKSTHK